jgi:transposase-like protein
VPLKNMTKTPPDRIEKAVKRYLQGNESASALAKEFNVSRPGFYAWINKYKAAMVEQARKSNMSAGTIDKFQKVDLTIENQDLKKQVMELKEKLFNLMLDTNRL